MATCNSRKMFNCSHKDMQEFCLPMHTNIYNQIYKQIDVHKRDEVRQVITTNYSENLKYAMCFCYILEEAVCIWYKVLLGSIVTVPIPGK